MYKKKPKFRHTFMRDNLFGVLKKNLTCCVFSFYNSNQNKTDVKNVCSLLKSMTSIMWPCVITTSTTDSKTKSKYRYLVKNFHSNSMPHIEIKMILKHTHTH